MTGSPTAWRLNTLRDGVGSLVLRGDANQTADGEVYQVRSAQRVVASVPWAGFAIAYALSPAGLVTVGALCGMLLVVGSGADEAHTRTSRTRRSRPRHRLGDPVVPAPAPSPSPIPVAVVEPRGPRTGAGAATVGAGVTVAALLSASRHRTGRRSGASSRRWSTAAVLLVLAGLLVRRRRRHGRSRTAATVRIPAVPGTPLEVARARSSARAVLVLTAGAVVALVAVAGGVVHGTLATFTDRGTLTTGSHAAADLLVPGNPGARSPGQSSPVTWSETTVGSTRAAAYEVVRYASSTGQAATSVCTTAAPHAPPARRPGSPRRPGTR